MEISGYLSTRSLKSYSRDLNNDVVRVFQLRELNVLNLDLIRALVVNRLHCLSSHDESRSGQVYVVKSSKQEVSEE
jgi:hypothetical protein